MKKFLLSVMILLFVALAGGVCSANPYDDDPNYVYLGTYGSGGYSTYLYLPSVSVQVHNSPHYQIAGDFVSIGGRKVIEEDWESVTVRFNWNSKETYTQNSYGHWERENINESYYRRRADALFRAAYGMDFYGY